MSDKLKSQLDAIFDTHNESKQKAQKQKSEREAREEDFVQSFYSSQATIIRPTYDRIGEYIRGRGYEYRIEENKESEFHDGRYQPPSIVIKLLTAEQSSRYSTNDYPHFSVICEKSQAKVRFHQSTMSPGRGGMSGGVGESGLSELTAELIEAKIVELLRQVFK